MVSLTAINSGQFVVHNLLHVVLDVDIVLLHHLIHDVIAVFISEVGDDGNWLVGFCLFCNIGIIDDDFSWKIFWSIRSPKLSETAPTNIPCVSVEILLGGIRLSICVLMEVEVS